MRNADGVSETHQDSEERTGSCSLRIDTLEMAALGTTIVTESRPQSET